MIFKPHPLLNPPSFDCALDRLEREEVESGALSVFKTSEVFENLRGLVGIIGREVLRLVLSAAEAGVRREKLFQSDPKSQALSC